MKPLRVVLPLFVTLSLSAVAYAQSDAQKSFDKLKALAGSWEGRATMDVPLGPSADDKPLQVSIRVTSRGNALMHEITGGGSPDDPITMLYLEGGRLLLTHYCDAGNRPRMAARTSADGKTVDFDFVDIEGNTEHGHMQHAAFTFIDENHHTEDWTFMLKGDKVVHGHLDLRRTR